MESNDQDLESSQEQTTHPRNKRNRNLWWCVLVALTALGISVLLFSLLSNSNDVQCSHGENVQHYRSYVESTTSNPASLDDCSTPQGRALEWLSNHDNAHMSLSRARILTRYALAVLYYSTNGENWFEQCWFLHENIHECKWFGDCISQDCDSDILGVVCDESTVMNLHFAGNNLVGSIPEEITLLHQMRTLNLAFNELSSTIPSILSELSTLRTLNLGGNSLVGTIPEGLDRLQYWNVHRNNLVGPLPHLNTTDLRYVLFSHNHLSGTIPPSFAHNRMRQLDLSNNDLQGTIPSELAQINRIQVIFLENNRLSGTVPSALAQTEDAIDNLHLQGNLLTGSAAPFCNMEDDLQSFIVDCTVECRCCDKFGTPQGSCLHMFDRTTSCKANNTVSDARRRLGSLQHEITYYRDIVAKTAKNPSVLDDPTSPQYQSLLWLVGLNDEHETLPEERILTRYALAVLYFSTHGCTWSDHDFFLQKDHECQWGTRHPKHDRWFDEDENKTYGVSCTDSETVDELFLPTMGLRGSIPDEIGLLQGLEVLQLQDGELSSTIPSEVFQLPSLRILSLGSNRELSGEIIAGDSSLRNLEQLDLTFNQLEGSFPWHAFQDNGKLRVLELYSNQFSGTVDWDILSSLSPTLTRLDLRNSGLVAGKNLPSSGMDNLEYLSLRSVGLSGTFPEMIAGMSNLEYVDLSRNFISGTLPTFLGSLDRLQSLSASDNKLTGGIPSELANLELLYALELSGNELTGTVPFQLGNMTSLDWLAISGNHLSGDLEFFCRDEVPANTTCGDADEMDDEECDEEDWSDSYDSYDDDSFDEEYGRFRIDISTDCSNAFTCSCCQDCSDSPAP